MKLHHGGSRDENYARILRALDISIAAASESRGIECCDCVGYGDGYSDVQPGECKLGDVHTKAALVAGALADMIANPAAAMGDVERCNELAVSLMNAFSMKREPQAFIVLNGKRIAAGEFFVCNVCGESATWSPLSGVVCGCTVRCEKCDEPRGACICSVTMQ